MRDESTPTRSAGLIQCGTPQEKRAAWLVGVGQHTCDVAEVREVLEDAVIIRNLQTNQLERLALPTAFARPAPLAHPVSEMPVETEREEIPGPVVLPVSADVVMVELRAETLRRYMTNLPEVLSSALATPHQASGGSAIDGYDISRVKADGIVEQLGIRNGDRLLEYNGQTLDSLSKVTGLFSQVQSLSGSRMTVLRDGSKVTFIYSVK